MEILPVVSLLLGPVKSLGPVLAIKIDNIAQARPRTGLTTPASSTCYAHPAQLLAEARGASTAPVVEREAFWPPP